MLTLFQNENKNLVLNANILEHNLLIAGPEGTGHEELLAFLITNFLQKEDAEVFYFHQSIGIPFLEQVMTPEIAAHPNLHIFDISWKWPIAKGFQWHYFFDKYERQFSCHERLKTKKIERPTMIIIDDFHLFSKNDRFRSRVENWLQNHTRWIGKEQPCQIILSSTSIEDFSQSPLKSIIQETMAANIFLSNCNALSPHCDKAYKDWNLTEEELETISCLEQRQNFYLKSSFGNFVFQLQNREGKRGN